MEGGGESHKTTEVSLNLEILEFYKYEGESKSVSNKVLIAVWCPFIAYHLQQHFFIAGEYSIVKNQKKFSEYLMLNIWIFHIEKQH